MKTSAAPSFALRSRIAAHIEQSIAAKRLVLERMVPEIERAAGIVIDALREGKKILFFGNGGSAGDAQHLAAEFVGRYERDRRPLAALALTTDTSILTSVSNDYSAELIFARQIEALGHAGDVAVAISTSGASLNVLRAVERAKSLGLKVVALTGHNGGELAPHADLALIVPSSSTSRIQESHIMIGHIICDLVDETLFG